MGIETSSVGITSAANASAASSQQAIASSQKTDSSFKNEMSKVSEAEKKDSDKTSEKKVSDGKSENNSDKKEAKLSVSEKKTEKKTEIADLSVSFNPQSALNDANCMLQNGIMEMIHNSSSVEQIGTKIWTFGFGDDQSVSNLKMTESDANFFLNLTQTDNITAQNIVSQAQNMIANGADFREVSQNVQISQTLLNALSEARQNNQPLRIDFDQNISVIIRVGKDGAISANFIPGDKAVEQYLRSNIVSLKNSFDEQDINYAELSYSNSSKRQNKQRREQQGE